MEEEGCSDEEVEHVGEAVSWFALEGSGLHGFMISATPTRLVQGAQPVIGETAPLTVGSDWQQIELINWYEDPVVLVGPPASRDAGEVVVRISPSCSTGAYHRAAARRRLRRLVLPDQVRATPPRASGPAPVLQRADAQTPRALGVMNPGNSA
jgi:hypothetical protein